MINYSLSLRRNNMDTTAAAKAYPSAQYTRLMTLDQFTEHIASHGCVYSRADIQAVLVLAVDCMREQLLDGQRIQLGDLGVFGITLRSKGAASIAEFTADDISHINVRWTPGRRFRNLRQEAAFELVPSRRAAAKVVQAVRAGNPTVDLTDPKKDDPSASTQP